MTLEILDLDHLNRTLGAVRKIPGVIHVERIKEYSKKTAKNPGEEIEGDSGPAEQTGTWVN